MTTRYDESWNTVAAGLAGATVYVQVGAFASETPVAVTDDDGGWASFSPRPASYNPDAFLRLHLCGLCRLP
jgi:hypothetical protein